MRIIKSSLTTLMVSNMDSTIHFYTKVLGFRLKARNGGHWAEIAAPGLTLALQPWCLSSMAREQSHFSIGFSVDDLDVAKQRLENKGVNFSGITTDGPTRMAFFTDPDGTPLYLSQQISAEIPGVPLAPAARTASAR